ncbi:MAG: hypothetical protein WB566_00070, partial [Terriglobales bacterium]
MSRFGLCLMLALLGTAGFLLTLNGCAGTAATVPPPTPMIQHVVVIFQENRTPDNLFQDSKLIAAGADIAISGVNSKGQTIPLTPIALANDYDLGHSHKSFESMYDAGKMDGADQIQVTCAPGAQNCPPPNAQFMYVNPSDVKPYFDLA